MSYEVCWNLGYFIQFLFFDLDYIFLLIFLIDLEILQATILILTIDTTMPPKVAPTKPVAKKKAGPNAHKLPDPIREGEILKDISKR